MPHNDLLSADHEHLSGIRLNDLVAKTARVTLKDTTRVLKSALMVAEFLGADPKDLLALDFDVERPTGEQSALCNEAFDEMCEAVAFNGGTLTVEGIRAIV